MDFLGLRNLTSLAAAVRLINERHPDKPIDLDKIPLDDPATYALLQRGEGKGLFQLEGAGIRDLLVKMKPDRFADLIALLALYRPGPLNGGMVDAYVNLKHGREKPEYPHPGDEGSPGRDLRGHGLPRTGHADPQPPGRHRAVVRVRDDQGDLEEEGRRHRPGAEAVRRGGCRAEARRAEGDRDLRPDRVLRRLRLQQVALDGLRPRPLPDGLAQGALPDRVHGRRALVGDGRRRAREVLRRTYRGLQADGPRGAAA